MKIATSRKLLVFCDVPGRHRTFVKLLKITMLSFYCGSVVTTNVLELLFTSTQQNFRYHFITLRHPGTFSKTLEINCKLLCHSNVSDFMCIFCHYRHLRTHYSQGISRFHQMYDFMILRHPGTFKVIHYKKSYIVTIFSIKLSFQSQRYRHPVI